MKELFTQFVTTLTLRPPKEKTPEAIADYSFRKYKKTYKLLEEYDKGTKRATKLVAKPGPLRKAISQVKGTTL